MSPIFATVTAGSPASLIMLYELSALCVVPTLPNNSAGTKAALLHSSTAAMASAYTGSGKTSLANLIVHSTPLRLARPTVGCNTYVTTVGGPEDGLCNSSQRQTFVELWDIGALLYLVA